IAIIRSALSMNPKLDYLYEWLGSIYRSQGDEESAQRELRQAVSLVQIVIDSNPLNPDGWWRMARLRNSLGQYDAGHHAKRTGDELSRNEFYGGDSEAIIASAFGRRSWQNEE